jgi:NAD(P)-dependent dehydrogenase (short-subunit alcohol dehydrogenase family)
MKLLLIGMGPGNGLAIAKRFGSAGFEVLMLARNESKLKAYEAELAAQGIRAQGFAVDISDSEPFGALLARLAAEHPDLDVLHYNASAYNPGAPSQTLPSVFSNDLKTNAVGALLAAQAFLPAMQARGQGKMFFTGGASALMPIEKMASLSAGKAAMRNLVLSMATEFAPLGIHVATVTIGGMVKAGTRFDPDLIAEVFWTLYEQPRAAWETEVVFE